MPSVGVGSDTESEAELLKAQRIEAQQVELEPRIIVGVHDVIPMDHLTEYFSRAFTTAAAELSRQGLFPAGPPVALYHGAPSEDAADITAGFPVAQPLA